MSTAGIPPIEIVILALVAVALLLQACFVLIVMIGMGKLARTIRDEMADVRSSVMPLIFDTRELLTKVSPKIESTADDLSAILHAFREPSASLGAAGTELAERIRRQSARVEGMLSNLMNTADRTGTVVAGSVAKPLRHLAGLVASARAALEVLRSPTPPPRTTRPADGQDMFV
jgi:uncharacterized protein YoxC